jgi:hypothetical protein
MQRRNALQRDHRLAGLGKVCGPARTAAALRAAKEKTVEKPHVAPLETYRQTLAILHNDLSLLPAKYRVPIVVCNLGLVRTRRFGETVTSNWLRLLLANGPTAFRTAKKTTTDYTDNNNMDFGAAPVCS